MVNKAYIIFSLREGIKPSPTNSFSLLLLLLHILPCCRDASTAPPPDVEPWDAGDTSTAEQSACTQGATYLFNNDFSPFYGGETSVDVEVVTYSSFYCDYCAQFAKRSEALWASRPDYQDRVRFYFHHWFVTPDLALAATAAYYQGLEYFWAMHDHIYERQLSEPMNPYTLEDMTLYAENVLKLDMEKFQADVESEETLSFLYWDKGQAAAYGVQGSPTVYICGEEVPRTSITEFKIEAIIDSYLNE
jgi:protein-disulfide isomerase